MGKARRANWKHLSGRTDRATSRYLGNYRLKKLPGDGFQRKCQDKSMATFVCGLHFLRERCGEGLCSRQMGTEKRLESRHQNGDSISKWVTGKKYSKQVKVVSLLLFLISQKCSINENSQFLPFLLPSICRSI